MTAARPLRYAVVIAAATSWGFWPVLLRRAESYGPINSALETTLVFAVMTLVGGIAAVFDHSSGVKRVARDWAAIFWLAIADAFNVLLLFKAYTATTVAVAVLTHYLTPIFVALAAPIVLRERAGPRTSVAVALSFAGLVLLLGPWAAGTGERGVLGAIYGAGSAFFYASNVLVNKRASGRFTTSELFFFHCLLATPVLALTVPSSSWGLLSGHAALFLAVGGVGPGALAGLAFIWALRGVPASHASTLALIEPLVAVLLGVFLLGEPLGVARAAGGAVILFGAWLIVGESRVAS